MRNSNAPSDLGDDMPTYEYRCGNCGHELEAVQSFSDSPLTVCPTCGQEALRKLFGNVGVVFKGPGFYRTDSRKDGSGASTPVKKASESAGDKAGSSGDSGASASPSSDKKPGAGTSGPSTSSSPSTSSTATTSSTSGGAAAS
jgi:putative FmdB family regulatory protein